MVELIPREVLFGNPERVSPAISPDGARLAWIAPHEGVLNVWVAPASAGSGVDWSAARVVTDDRDRGIRMFEWAHDARHLLYLQDTGGDENWRLHDVDLETMDRRDLTPFDGVQARVVATERKFPTDLLVALNRDNPELHDVYKLDLVTGELTKVVENPGFIGFLADAQLAVRATIAPQPDGSLVVMVRDSAEADWRPLLTVPADDALTSELDRVQRGRRLDSRRQLGRREHRQAAQDRLGERCRGGAGGRSGGRRERRQDPAGHQGAADRDLRQGQVGVPRARPLGRRRRDRDPRAAPRRSRVHRRRRLRHDVARRVHQRLWPDPLLRLRPGQQGRALPVREPARAVPATSSPRWSRSRSPPATASPCTAMPRSRPVPTAPACPP